MSPPPDHGGPPVRLLVSVRTPREALDALEGGADIIDIKDPARGSLGMADLGVITRIVTAVNGRCPVSAALGELHEHRALAGLPPQIAYTKVGLFDAPQPWRIRLAARYAQAPHARPIAVAYADDTRADTGIDEVTRWAIDHGAAGVLVDTHRKDGRGLFDVPGVECVLYRAIQHTRDHHLLVALAGSLMGAAFERALALNPDIVAVRGAACSAGDRSGAIDRARVRALADLISIHNARRVPHAR